LIKWVGIDVSWDFIIICLLFPVPLVSEFVLSPVEGSVVVLKFMVITIVWDKVVLIIAVIFLLVLILGAAGGVANWIRIEVNVS
jgi:hypothetical protein